MLYSTTCGYLHYFDWSSGKWGKGPAGLGSENTPLYLEVSRGVVCWNFLQVRNEQSFEESDYASSSDLDHCISPQQRVCKLVFKDGPTSLPLFLHISFHSPKHRAYPALTHRPQSPTSRQTQASLHFLIITTNPHRPPKWPRKPSPSSAPPAYKAAPSRPSSSTTPSSMPTGPSAPSPATSPKKARRNSPARAPKSSPPI